MSLTRALARPSLTLGVQRLAFIAALISSVSASALSPTEKALLSSSLRASERNGVIRALGGLDQLPLRSLDIEIHPDERRMHGHARLEWTNRTGSPLRALFVRLAANSKSSKGPSVEWNDVEASIDGGPYAEVTTEEHSPTILRIELPKALSAGKRVVLRGKLSGVLVHVADSETDLVSSAAGSGRNQTNRSVHHGTFACSVTICTLNGFAPDIPAFEQGAFDLVESRGIGDSTYSAPSNLMLSVVVPADATVAATGIEVGRVSEQQNRRRWTYVMAGARDATVVVSSQFVVDEAIVHRVRVRSYALERHRDAGRRALTAATGALSAFDAAFGRYPWAELTIAESALAGGAGGLESSGLVLGATGLYKADAPRQAGFAAFAAFASSLQQEMLDFVIRHEVAHQWWHGVVGSHPQHHPWVDEPLAQWSALYATQIADGQGAARRARQVQVELNFHAYRMMGGEDGRVARAASAFADQQEYAALMYGKAPLFFAALSEEIGEKKMLQALRQYAVGHRFKRAPPDALQNALVKVASAKGGQVQALWKRWFHDSRGDEDLGTVDPMNLFRLLGGEDVKRLPPSPP